ncbi:hypothetical protein ACIBCM_10410 [Streptomyces sp. NPDC051018]|uniref:hypothetical protein n=1 Tax=Streptomyces sp. NPDC051018 TaxID=3365639 RepID=UPI00378E5D99
MTDEATRWSRFAALLSPDRAQEVMDCRAIGEQEAGLDLLVGGLLADGVAISETTRAEIAVASELWGVWPALEPDIRRCRSQEQDRSRGREQDRSRGRDEVSLRLIEPSGTAPLDGSAIGPQAALAGLSVVPWIVCDRCGHTLGRACIREPWGELSFMAQSYVLYFPGRRASTTLFDTAAAWSAVDTVRLSCGRASSPRPTAG